MQEDSKPFKLLIGCPKCNFKDSLEELTLKEGESYTCTACEESFRVVNGKSQLIKDTEEQEFVICPYCGHQHDALEEFEDDEKVSCHNCEKTFSMVRNTIVTYSTYKIPPRYRHIKIEG